MMCLKRAKSAPLDIFLHPSSTPYLPYTREDHWLASLLIPYTQNIKILGFITFRPPSSKPSFRISPSRCPISNR